MKPENTSTSTLLTSRAEQMHAFLQSAPQTLALDLSSVATASSDASFRRYFRVQGNSNNGLATVSYIVMDAPPDKENCQPFVEVAQRLKAAGVQVPDVVHASVASGFLLLTDFGNTPLLSTLNTLSAETSAAQVRAEYQPAFDQLLLLQATDTEGLPEYDEPRLLAEMQLFTDWYVLRHCGYALSDKQTATLAIIFKRIAAVNLTEPQVCVHRDYHSRNLMVLADGTLGVIDFQDAVRGPISYDLVSLLRDAYIAWPEDMQLDLAIRYWQQARAAGLPIAEDFGQFWRDFEWMGLQRHLKVLGIFARLNYRDGKAQYLRDLPCVLNYAKKVAGRYDDLRFLVQLFDALEGVQRPVGFTF